MVRKERLVTTSTEPLHVRPLGARHPTGALANPARLTVNLEPTACVVIVRAAGGVAAERCTPVFM